MFQFGSGLLFVNPVGGNEAVNPTPNQVLTLQDCSVDISIELKELLGQNQYPDDVAPGNKKITGKFTFGNNNIDLFNQIIFSDTRATGVKAIAARESHTVSGAAATVTNSANFLTDLGVTYQATGVPFIRVASAPAVGQYSVSAGVYTFNATDNASVVLISYVWNDTALGRTVQINNQLMGYGSIFELWLAEPYQAVSGINNGLHLYACRASKLTQDLKRDGYKIPTIDYTAFANASGAVGELFQVVA